MADSELDIQDITKPFDELEALITSKPGSNRSPLWQAWTNLQVYATWGVRLPTATTDFTAVLGTSPAQFKFFPPMKEGNTIIQKACEGFLKNGYSNVVAIGRDLKSYAENVSNTEGGTVEFILDMIKDDDMETALDVLNDLQTGAEEAFTRAGEVKTALDAFSADLKKATGKLGHANTSLDADSATNQDAIAKLEGDEKVAGSLDSLRKALKTAQDDYDHYVVVAATSPTYVWVAPPLGMIATATVAGIYGDKAVKTLKEVDRLEDEIKKKSSALATARAAHAVYEQADKGLEYVLKYTTAAIANISIVQQSWGDIIDQIKTLKENIHKTTDDKSGEEVIVRKRKLEFYLDKVESTWTKLIPGLRDLMTDNYISVEPGTMSAGQAAAKIEGEMAAAGTG